MNPGEPNTLAPAEQPAKRKHWADCGMNHGYPICDMGEDCGTDPAQALRGEIEPHLRTDVIEIFECIKNNVEKIRAGGDLGVWLTTIESHANVWATDLRAALAAAPRNATDGLPSNCIQRWWQAGYDASTGDAADGVAGQTRSTWCGHRGHSCYCPAGTAAATLGATDARPDERLRNDVLAVLAMVKMGAPRAQFEPLLERAIELDIAANPSTEKLSPVSAASLEVEALRTVILDWREAAHCMGGRTLCGNCTDSLARAVLRKAGRNA